MPAAISWLQSKMTWNSLPLFISFSKGFASFVSAGSWRILSRRLYLDGALMSSCKRMRPLMKKKKKKKNVREKSQWIIEITKHYRALFSWPCTFHDVATEIPASEFLVASVFVNVSCAQSCLTLCDPMDSARLLCPWDFPGKNTGVGCHFLLQRISLIQGSDLLALRLLHCILYPLSHQGSPIFVNITSQNLRVYLKEWKTYMAIS